MNAIKHEDLERNGYVYNQETKSYERREDYSSPVVASVQVPIVECPLRHDALPKNTRKKGSPKRFKISITGHTKRPVDPCNFSTKYAVDALRFAGIIEDDSWAHIKLKPEQQKVETEDEEGTEILIEAIE